MNTIRNDEQFLWICTGIWAVSCLFSYSFRHCLTTLQFAEMSNLHTHLTLRSLRPEGTRKRAIPQGYGFDLVSCPNYFFEILGWAVIALMTGSIAGTLFLSKYHLLVLNLIHIAILFTGVSAVTMSIWALKKQRNYQKEFGKEYPRGRKAIIPFIL